MVKYFNTDKYENRVYSSSITSTTQKTHNGNQIKIKQNMPSKKNGEPITINKIPMQIISCLTSMEKKKFKLFLDSESTVIRKKDTKAVPFSIRLNNHRLHQVGYIIISNTDSCDKQHQHVLSMVIAEDNTPFNKEVYTGNLNFRFQLLN
jgi:hypothetical protein